MALALPPGLTPSEVAFICEMESITVVARQKLDSIQLIGGPTPILRPPQRTNLPLWLALLLKRQRRINIVPPPWLQPATLNLILELETDIFPDTFSPPTKKPFPSSRDAPPTTSPPFWASCTADAPDDALPYHWLEMGEILLNAAGDDFEEPDVVRRLMRDLREVRMAKLRSGIEVLEAGGGVKMNGVGGMEVSEGRGFIGGVIDGLRRINASREQARRERDEEAGDNGLARADDDDDDDDDML